ncbi:MAG: electron transfer flavoprotein subunit alpha/FixB family protein [Desulfuromonadales bacterium]|nr:electron transfer flavoprotein subunit alpha/FixB family protein [Desulfuromonadales bacterium]
MKTLILSTDENAVRKAYQFLCERSIATEAKGLHLSLSGALPGDGYEVLRTNYDLSSYGLIVLSDRDFDQEIAGAIASNMDIPCVTSCSNIELGDEGIRFQRVVYGGLAHMNLLTQRTPLVMTVSCAAFGEGPFSDLPIDRLEAAGSGTRSRIVSSREIEKGVDLGSAKRIVAVGRGVAKKEDLEMIDQLTRALEAELGCSRPLSEDYKWLPLERQVGLTGETVKPQLYLAVGISGQVQHIAGMRDAGVVVAINNNKGAPIFDCCDYGLVGDLYEIVPRLTEVLSGRA